MLKDPTQLLKKLELQSRFGDRKDKRHQQSMDFITLQKPGKHKMNKSGQLANLNSQSQERSSAALIKVPAAKIKVSNPSNVNSGAANTNSLSKTLNKQ